MKQIVEHESLLLEIEYETDEQPDQGPIINSVRTLDTNYRAVGPNLVRFLNHCYLETGPAEASKFLSHVVVPELT